jgi:hypothetical protein
VLDDPLVGSATLPGVTVLGDTSSGFDIHSASLEDVVPINCGDADRG